MVSRLRVSWAEAHAQARWMGRLYPENENDSQIVEKGHGTERASVFKERVSEPSKNCTQLTSIHILSSICASGDMGGGLMYLRYFEAKKAEAADPRALLKTRRLVMSL